MVSNILHDFVNLYELSTEAMNIQSKMLDIDKLISEASVDHQNLSASISRVNAEINLLENHKILAFIYYGKSSRSPSMISERQTSMNQLQAQLNDLDINIKEYESLKEKLRSDLTSLGFSQDSYSDAYHEVLSVLNTYLDESAQNLQAMIKFIEDSRNQLYCMERSIELCKALLPEIATLRNSLISARSCIVLNLTQTGDSSLNSANKAMNLGLSTIKFKKVQELLMNLNQSISSLKESIAAAPMFAPNLCMMFSDLNPYFVNFLQLHDLTLNINSVSQLYNSVTDLQQKLAESKDTLMNTINTSSSELEKKVYNYCKSRISE